MVRRVNDIDDGRGVREVAPPIWSVSDLLVSGFRVKGDCTPDAGLSAQVPNLEFDILVL